MKRYAHTLRASSRRWLRSLLMGALALSAAACEKALMGDDMEPTARNTFEYLWQRVDEQYALFDVKGVDWMAARDEADGKVYDGMTSDSLFSVLAEMLNKLDDGHVNLKSGFDVSRCTNLFRRMQEMKDIDMDVVLKNYLGYGYHTTGGFAHQAIRDGKVIYVRYGSFLNPADPAYLTYIVDKYPQAKGLILDIRQNGGGQIDNTWNLLQMLPERGQLLYSTQIKNGPRHNDFTPPKAVHAPKAKQGIATYGKPVCVLTDRGSYSASSYFALCARTYDNVTLVGDTTGGGLGLPNGGDLPNGWHYRFSVTRTLDPEGVNYENGVPPDTVVRIVKGSEQDLVIETAANIILGKKEGQH